MTSIMEERLQSFLQRVCQAVATVLQLDVTVVDHQLRRVAGTGPYAAQVGQPVPPSSSFAEVMRTGKPRIILHPREDPACQRCEATAECQETCHVSYPLEVGDRPIGVLALVGFTREQQQRMSGQAPQYLAFIEQMARLVENAAENIDIARALQEARDQLRGVVEAVREGIIAVDAQGKVICCNRAAAAILRLGDVDPVGRQLPEFLPHAPMLDILSTGTGYVNREVTIPSPAGTLRHMSTGTPLLSNGSVVGAVALLKSLEEVHQMAYDLSEGQPDQPIDHILGVAPSLQQAKQLALRAASGSATVLLLGESGTGKELFARAIHYHSPRGTRPFVAVNCAAVPEDLLESELFGYEEGAFTGARKGGKPGKFELAHGGTLFLDEVADCSLRLQAKLLRALDRGEVQRVGGTRVLTVDVRVVAATNKDLEEMVRQGEFREDLYFRLNVIPIQIPPLRERRTDVLPLFRHFLQKHALNMHHTVPDLAGETARLLEQYWWPGNVRELENVAQYVLHACRGKVVEPQHLPPRLLHSLQPAEPPAQAAHGAVCSACRGVHTTGAGGDSGNGGNLMTSAEWERQAIADGLRRLGKTPRAKEILAAQLGMSRSTIYRKIKEYGLQ
ncbi:MAG: sigma 54-interacting transcriptional regulator [Bacillota bacterium]|nr:sigma 54-interacting transcriptional regulator [Bacillota bacterium]MDI7250168.1 sigma 54-interacting transcriptional regulator [Bacillota bacterium]